MHVLANRLRKLISADRPQQRHRFPDVGYLLARQSAAQEGRRLEVTMEGRA